MTFPSEPGNTRTENQPAGTTSLELRGPKTAFCVALLILWLLLEIGLQWTRSAYIDEAFYSFPAHNFLKYGTWDSREIEPSAYIYLNSIRPLTRIDKQSYNQMPLFYLAETIWYRAFGFGLKQARLLSLCFSSLALFLWFRLVRLWSGCDTIALAATVFIAFNWLYISEGALGRPDTLGHLFGLFALYVHERYYRSAPVRSCGAATLLLAAAALTHPNAGIVWGGVFLWRFIGQRRAWSLAQFGAFAVAGAFAAACFAIWAGQDPVAFRDQMMANGVYRFTWAGNPFQFLWAELKRYAGMYGLEPSRPLGPTLLKFYSLLPVGAALAFMPGSRVVPMSEGLKNSLKAGGIAMAMLALADRSGFPQYGLHVTPWFGVVAGFVFGSKGCGRNVRRVALLSYVGAATVVVGAAMYQRPYQNSYLPAVSALSQLHHSDSVVFAPAEFHFAYDSPFVYDVRFGFLSGRSVPAFAAKREDVTGAMDWSAANDPAFHQYLVNLTGRCRVVFENGAYVVYSCRP